MTFFLFLHSFLDKHDLYLPSTILFLSSIMEHLRPRQRLGGWIPPPKEGGTCRGPHLWGAEDTRAPLPWHSLARGPPPPCLSSARLLHPIPGVCRKISRLDKDQSVGAMDTLELTRGAAAADQMRAPCPPARVPVPSLHAAFSSERRCKTPGVEPRSGFRGRWAGCGVGLCLVGCGRGRSRPPPG